MRHTQSAAAARWLRHFGGIAGGAACLLICGCASAPISADQMFGGTPAQAGTTPLSGPASGRDGVYVGTAVVDVNGNYSCVSPMSVTNFRVEGNTLRFAGFDGAIDSDGSVRLPFRHMWLTGRFDGSKFTGYVDASAAWILFHGCIYAITVTRQTGSTG